MTNERVYQLSESQLREVLKNAAVSGMVYVDANEDHDHPEYARWRWLSTKQAEDKIVDQALAALAERPTEMCDRDPRCRDGRIELDGGWIECSCSIGRRLAARLAGKPLASSPEAERGALAGADVVCQHGTAMDVHCCNCHSGFLFDVNSCVCGVDALTERGATALHSNLVRRLRECADREMPADAEESAWEDVPEITWQDMKEIASLLREAADALGERVAPPQPQDIDAAVNAQMDALGERAGGDAPHRAVGPVGRIAVLSADNLRQRDELLTIERVLDEIIAERRVFVSNARTIVDKLQCVSSALEYLQQRLGAEDKLRERSNATSERWRTTAEGYRATIDRALDAIKAGLAEVK